MIVHPSLLFRALAPRQGKLFSGISNALKLGRATYRLPLKLHGFTNAELARERPKDSCPVAVGNSSNLPNGSRCVWLFLAVCGVDIAGEVQI
jgi:hypothetical protein